MKDNDKRLWLQTLWTPIKEKYKSPLESNESGIKVAAYCRVSTKADIQLRSLENQVSHYTHYIRSKTNWRFVGIYFDDGVTGAVANRRRGFQRLIRHAEEGKVDLILTKNISRFSRNSKELIDIVNHLKDLSVGVYFENENIDTSVDYSEFLLSTYAALAQEEIESLSNSTTWGHEKRLLQGIPLFGPVMGYEMVQDGENTRLVINDQEARTVKLIFDMYLKDNSLTEIMRYLTRQGITTSQGKRYWNVSGVKYILSNVTYTGNKLMRQEKRNLLSNTRKFGVQDQIFLADTHEAIISNEVFNEVQKKLQTNKRISKSPIRKPNPVSKRMVCGRCGYFFTTIGSVQYRYFRCKPGIEKNCDSEIYKEENIRDMMIKAMREKFNFDDEDIALVLLKELEKINQNDHFEFHRLKYLTEIEIAKKEYEMVGGETKYRLIKQMEEDYKAFESRIIKIEDDRSIRLKAVKWIRNNIDIESIVSNITVEILRAFITDMIVYTSQDFKVSWVDGTETEIGDYSELIKLYKIEHTIEEKNTNYNNEDLDNEDLIKSETNELCLLEVSKESRTGDMEIEQSITRKGEEDIDLSINGQADIIKIEPGQREYVMKSLNKNLSKNMINQYVSINVPPLNKSKVRAAAYCRVSTDSDEQKVSLKTQVAYYTYLILKDPKYEYAGIYADEGISGRSLKNRKEFLKLMEECKAGNVDLILTKSISRFSRNALDCIEKIRMLRSLPNPVYVYFEKENIHTKDEKGELMISIYSSIAQEESVNIGESLAWGRRKYAERGIVNPPHVPYGYIKMKNGEWIIDDEEAKTVKLIFQMALEGKTYYEIGKILTLMGIKTPKGGENWYSTRIKTIIKDESYRGNYLYQKSYTKDSIEKKVVDNKGEFPQYLIENHHEAIISDEMWKEVQDKIENRLKVYINQEKENNNYMALKNKAFIDIYTCGECGGLLGPISMTKNVSEIHHWYCNRARKTYLVEKCNSITFRQKYLEKHFMKTLLNMKNQKVFNQKVLNYIESLKPSEEKIKKAKRIEEEIKILNNELYKTVDQELNKEGQDSKKVDELTDKIVALQLEMKKFTENADKVKYIINELNWINKELEGVDEKLINSTDGLGFEEKMYFRKDIFERIISGARVFSDGEIIYNLRVGLEWTIDYSYDDFKELDANWKKEIRKKKKEAFLNGPEVNELLSFCTEPKNIHELYKFMCERKKMSLSYFRDKIVRQLVESGKLKRTIPDVPNHNNQQYIS